MASNQDVAGSIPTWGSIFMKYKAVIFDLDGTLLDTLFDIVGAVNFALEQTGNDKRYSYEEGILLIGSGAYTLARRAYSFKQASEEEFLKFQQLFFDTYLERQGRTTKPFGGIVELLSNLKSRGIKLCVASNKPDHLLKIILNEKMPSIAFDVAKGHKPGYKEKPDPRIVNEIKQSLLLNDDECLYIGDSHTDIETAKNANIDICLVTYGYEKYTDELKKSNLCCFFR